MVSSYYVWCKTVMDNSSHAKMQFFESGKERIRGKTVIHFFKLTFPEFPVSHYTFECFVVEITVPSSFYLTSYDH